MIRRRNTPVVLYPRWLSSTLYVIPLGGAVGSFFMGAFWFMLGYNITWTQVAVVGLGVVLGLIVIGARALFRSKVRKQHPGVHVRFL